MIIYRTFPVQFLNYKLLQVTALIKGVCSRSYCCYGNLLCHEDNHNMLSNDWAVFFDSTIVASRDKEWL